MDFSPVVLNIIDTLKSVNRDYDTNVISQIRDAIECTDNEVDVHILRVIWGAMTMAYVAENDEFTARFKWSDGTESFSPKDLSSEDFKVLTGIIQVVKSNFIRTKFAHIVWVSTKEHQYGGIAVNGYMASFREQFDTEKWTKCFSSIAAAYKIASAIGKKTDLFKLVYAKIQQKITEMNGSDKLFLSLRLMSLTLKDASPKDLFQYANILKIIAEKNFSINNQNPSLADETFESMEKVYRRLKDDAEINKAKLMYAHYYEDFAKQLANTNDYFRAVHFLKKACTLYHGLSKEKLWELKSLLENWQGAALNNMTTHKFEFDVKPIREAVEEAFTDLSREEAIIEFGRFAKIYDVEDVKKNLLDESEDSVFSSLFGSSLLNEYGQSVEELPPISVANNDPDSDIFQKHMVHYAAECRSLADSVSTEIAYHIVRKHGTFTESDFDFLVRDNGLIPENRVEIIEEGLSLGFNGKIYAAMHILLPQTENIFRNLVKLCGDTVTFLNAEKGTESFRPLSSLFKSEKLQECYDENLIFTFRSIMDEPAGENLRNLCGHGLLEPQVGNGRCSIHFLSLFVMLISMYGITPLSIRNELGKRERLKDSEENS